MKGLFKMTPLQGEPARESNRTLYQPTSFNMGLEKFPKQIQHELSRGTTGQKFCTPSIVKMAVGFRQKWRYSNSRGFGQTTSLCTPVIELELELGVQQRLDTLTCLDHHLSSCLILPFHHCTSMFFFQL